jgi:hypothetical protein
LQQKTPEDWETKVKGRKKHQKRIKAYTRRVVKSFNDRKLSTERIN